MMKQIAILLFSCFLFACQSQKDKNNFADLIKGDWLGPDQSEERGFNQTKFICFEDSTCRTSLWKSDFDYKIREDSLYITSIVDEKADQVTQYKILKLTTDSLVLLPRTKEKDTLAFSKVHPKNNTTPSTIYFASSGCYGSCPVMSLEIDSSLNIRFYGFMHTSLKGGFSGKISRNDYNSIISKIRNLPIDSLHERYEADWTDDQALGMSIVHGNTNTHSVAYGHYKEPMELHLVFSKLINLYQKANLQRDSTVDEVFVFEKVNQMMGPLIPLPPKVNPPSKKLTLPHIINLDTSDFQPDIPPPGEF